MGFLLFLLALSAPLQGNLKGTKRPRKIFIVAKRGSARDIIRIPLYRGSNKYYTRDAKREDSLTCAHGKLIYTAGSQIYWQSVTKPLKETKIGKLPVGLVAHYGGKLRRFISLSSDGKRLMWPGNVELNVKDFKGNFSARLFPPQGRGIVHPASWRPGGAEIFYMTHEKKSGRLLFHFRDVTKKKDRRIISTLGTPIEGVQAFETHFSRDGQWLAVNLDASPKKKSVRRFFVLMNIATGKVVTLPRGYGVQKFHGFSWQNHLILTAGRGKNRSVYKMGPLPKTHIKRIDKIGVEDVYGYFPARNSLLLNQRWKCVKPRLTNLGFYGTRKRLLRWARWTEVIAQDVTRTWGIFRGGGGCHTTKPNLYLMRMDGSLLLREMPKGKFMRLRSLSPSQIAICD